MSVLAALASSKIAVSAAALGALTVGGFGTAAYTGSLPTDAQQVAHQVIGAPAPKPVQDAQDAATAAAQHAKGEAAKDAASATDAATKAASDARDGARGAVPQATPGTSASGAADIDILGLCHANAQGALDAASAGFKSLALAANGEANVAAFCQAHDASASAEGSAGADSALDAVPAAPSLPSLPAVPGQNALPSAPAAPSSVPALPTAAPSVPSEVTKAVRP